MTKRLRSRFSYANVVSTLALFLVIAGGVALGRAETQKGGPTIQHQLKVVKGLVKEVEAGQAASSQQTQGKLEDIHNAVIDAHLQLDSRLVTALQRLKSLCWGEEFLSRDHRIHDDRSPTFVFGPQWEHCYQATLPSTNP